MSLFLLVIGECYECESWNVRKLLITTCVPRQDSGQSVHPYSPIKFSPDAVKESSLGALAMNYIFLTASHVFMDVDPCNDE